MFGKYINHTQFIHRNRVGAVPYFYHVLIYKENRKSCVITLVVGMFCYVIECSTSYRNVTQYILHVSNISNNTFSKYFTCYCYLELRRNLPCVFLLVNPLQHALLYAIICMLGYANPYITNEIDVLWEINLLIPCLYNI